MVTPATPEHLVLVRAAEAGLRASDIRGPCRLHRVVRVRAWIAAELRSTFGLSYPAIGRVLGGRHHTTIMYLLGHIERKCKAVVV